MKKENEMNKLKIAKRNPHKTLMFKEWNKTETKNEM